MSTWVDMSALKHEPLKVIVRISSKDAKVVSHRTVEIKAKHIAGGMYAVENKEFCWFEKLLNI